MDDILPDIICSLFLHHVNFSTAIFFLNNNFVITWGQIEVTTERTKVFFLVFFVWWLRVLFFVFWLQNGGFLNGWFVKVLKYVYIYIPLLIDGVLEHFNNQNGHIFFILFTSVYLNTIVEDLKVVRQDCAY